MGYIINPYTYATGTPFENEYSLAFDGVDDYVSINSDATLNDIHLNPFTISFWFKTSSGGTMILTEKATSSSATARAFYVYLSSGVIIWYGATASPSYTAGSYNDGNWHHVACVAESDTVARIYVDGVDDTNNISKDRIGTSTVTAPIIIGTTYNQSGFFLDGNIDEYSIFNSALSSSDVTSIYNSGTPSDLSSLNPTAWWRMGDNGTWKSPQWLLPENSNKDKVSNYSFEFDGVDDYIEIPNITPRFGTQNPATADSAVNAPWSINLWAYIPSGVSGTTPLYNTPLGFATYTWTLIWSGTKIQFGARYSSLRVYETGTTAVNTDQWNNITVTFDGVDANTLSSWKLYINGVDITALSSGSHLGTNTSGKTYIGRGLSSYAEVKMDEGSVYDVKLTASNVTSLYNSGEPTTLPVTPLAHWKLGEDATFSTNWTVPDAVGSNDGTSANMTIEDRVGNAPSSINNALSYNMDEADREEETP